MQLLAVIQVTWDLLHNRKQQSLPEGRNNPPKIPGPQPSVFFQPHYWQEPMFSTGKTYLLYRSNFPWPRFFIGYEVYMWDLTYGWLTNFCFAPWFDQIYIWPIRSAPQPIVHLVNIWQNLNGHILKLDGLWNGLGNQHVDSFRHIYPPSTT